MVTIMGSKQGITFVTTATLLTLVIRSVLSQNNEPISYVFTLNNNEGNEIRETPAQDRSLVPPYDINPYFGFRKYGEMRYEPLNFAYLSNNGFLSNLFDGARSGRALPNEDQSRSGKSTNDQPPSKNTNKNYKQQINPMQAFFMNPFA